MRKSLSQDRRTLFMPISASACAQSGQENMYFNCQIMLIRTAHSLTRLSVCPCWCGHAQLFLNGLLRLIHVLTLAKQTAVIQQRNTSGACLVAPLEIFRSFYDRKVDSLDDCSWF